MTKQIINWILPSLCMLLLSCTEGTNSTILSNNDSSNDIPRHLWHDIAALNEDSTINVIIEIPAGTSEKWEVSKQDGKLELEFRDGSPRIVNYLPYPFNYGMVPQTYLPKEKGGDGDPLDVIVLGSSLDRGSIISVYFIGVIRLTDNGEKDDKVIAVPTNGLFCQIRTIEDLENNYQGILNIITTWLQHYKSTDIEIQAIEGQTYVTDLLNSSMQEYRHFYN